MKKTDLLKQYINESRKMHSDQRKYMFKVVKWYKYPLVTLSAISTIILGLQIGDDWVQWQKNLALITTAIITLLTTLMTFWNVEEYWLQNKVIEQQLMIFQQKFEFETTNDPNPETVEKLFQEYQSIVGQQHSYWKGALDDRVNNEKAGD